MRQLRSYNFMKVNENIWLFNADSYQEVSNDWLTATLKYDITEVGKQCCLTHGSWDESDRLGCVHYTQTGLNKTR